MSTDGALAAVVEDLVVAHRTATALPPLSRSRPGLALVDAYRIQQQLVARWVADGDAVRGHKIGLASEAMQQQMGVDEPDFGHLTQRMFRTGTLSRRQLVAPRVEPELAVVLGEPLRGPGVTVAEATAAVAEVAAALEVVDSRIADWDVTIVDTVADNASSGAVFLGPSVPLHGLGPRARDLTTISVRLEVSSDGRTVVEHGTGAAVLGSPMRALAWLANTLGRLGVTLEPGHCVLTGSFTRSVALQAGDRVVATFSDVAGVAFDVTA